MQSVIFCYESPSKLINDFTTLCHHSHERKLHIFFSRHKFSTRKTLVAALFGVIFHLYNVALSCLLFCIFRTQSSKALLLFLPPSPHYHHPITPKTPKFNQNMVGTIINALYMKPFNSHDSTITVITLSTGKQTQRGR